MSLLWKSISPLSYRIFRHSHDIFPRSPDALRHMILPVFCTTSKQQTRCHSRPFSVQESVYSKMCNRRTLGPGEAEKQHGHQDHACISTVLVVHDRGPAASTTGPRQPTSTTPHWKQLKIVKCPTVKHQVFTWYPHPPPPRPGLAPEPAPTLQPPGSAAAARPGVQSSRSGSPDAACLEAAGTASAGAGAGCCL